MKRYDYTGLGLDDIGPQMVAHAIANDEVPIGTTFVGYAFPPNQSDPANKATFYILMSNDTYMTVEAKPAKKG